MSEPVTCAWCGAVAASEGDRLAWTCSVEAGEQRWYCVACSREHVRSIESKLDQEWW